MNVARDIALVNGIFYVPLYTFVLSLCTYVFYFIIFLRMDFIVIVKLHLSWCFFYFPFFNLLLVKRYCFFFKITVKLLYNL